MPRTKLGRDSGSRFTNDNEFLKNRALEHFVRQKRVTGHPFEERADVVGSGADVSEE